MAKTKEQLAGDLKQQLKVLEESSGSQNSLGLAVFVPTLIGAGGIVHLTIKRAITGPVVRVIGGAQGANDEAARASQQMAQSGKGVSINAQEQAACIEERSASLEAIFRDDAAECRPGGRS